MLLLSLALALAGPAPAPCTLATSPTLADQFLCYKNAGRKIAFPETQFFAVEPNGTGCIIAIGADRMEVGPCDSFSRTTITVTYASIRTVVDNPDQEWVSVFLVDNTQRPSCWPDCNRVEYTPPPRAPAPARPASGFPSSTRRNGGDPSTQPTRP